MGFCAESVPWPKALPGCQIVGTSEKRGDIQRLIAL